MMRHSAIPAGADIAPNVKSELIDYADRECGDPLGLLPMSALSNQNRRRL
jgi:hypothetical protein